MDKAKKLLQELEQEIPQKEAGGFGNITYDDSGMLHAVDNFVRFLIGDSDIALKNLQKFGNPRVKGLKPGDEYNEVFNTLFNGFIATVKKGLGR